MTAPAVPTLAERAARGKRAREDAPRRSHAGWEPPRDRADPVAILERQAATRIPELVPIRYARMLVSPFAFYRGAAALMAADLAATPRSGLTVQCCGDAHLANFGVFASPDRRLVFDLNDFDETHPGPWEWDLKRLATSLLIAARANGFKLAEQERVVLETAAAYRTAMAEFAAMDNLAVWYARAEADALLERFSDQVSLKSKEVRGTRRVLAKARTRDSMSAFEKLTHVVDGEVRIVDQSPLITPIEHLEHDRGGRADVFEWLRGLVGSYGESLPAERRVLFDQFALVDFAHKVVGVGSVGTRCWIALLLGRDGREPLFLQIKEAGPSVLEEHLGPSAFANHGERVVVGQRLMQADSDILLGWLRVEGDRDYYCRQLKDWKGSAELEELRPDGMTAYGRLCAWTLARAHARSGDRVAIAAYLGSGDRFDRALVDFAVAYAEQNERDYDALAGAVDAGRVEAAAEP